MKPQSRRDYERGRMAEAAKVFAEHTLRELSPSSWAIDPPVTRGASFQTCYVTAIGGYLIVVGDCDTCVFVGHRADEPRGMVGWMGAHRDLHYVAEKAHIGMTDRGNITTDYEAAVALDDLKELRECYADNNGEENESKAIEAITEAEARVVNGDDNAQKIREDLYDTGCFDSESVLDLGEVTAWRVIVAHAVVARLWSLLSAEGVQK